MIEASSSAPQHFRAGAFVRLLRVQQWVKNIFLFFPAFFAAVILQPDVLLRTSLGFLCFSMAASAIYMFNDARDVEQDRLHPTKKTRPIAAGEIPLKLVPWLGLPLMAVALVGAWLVEPRFALVLGVYAGMNILYSIRLKHIPIVDVTIIAVGFLLRVFAGGILARVPVSNWIEIVTFLLALFIALAKRRDDLVQSPGDNRLRASLKGYNLQFIDAAMVTLAAVMVQSYIMYTVSPEVVDRLGNDNVYGTSVFVVLGVMRYFQLSLVEKRTGSPTKLILTDLPIQLIILGWVLSFGAIIYAF